MCIPGSTFVTRPKAGAVPRPGSVYNGPSRNLEVMKKRNDRLNTMKLLILIVAFCILAVLCWPLALLALVLFPVIWLITLPLRLIGIVVGATLALVRAILFLPARLLGVRR